MLLDLALSLALAGTFFLSGIAKLAGVPRIAAQFERWGYVPSVRLAGGVMEVAGAGLLLAPDMTLYGVLVLLGVLGTAVYTHVIREKLPSHALPSAILLVMVVFLGLLRGSVTAGIGGTVFRAMFG